MTRSWSRELVDRASVNTVNPGPEATDMYAHMPASEFESMSKPFMLHTPLAKVRPEVDGEELVKCTEAAGGRPAYDHECRMVHMAATAAKTVDMLDEWKKHYLSRAS